jgi:hypothetical protein
VAALADVARAVDAAGVGPLGGLVSVFRAVSVEPLIALGLSS